jgi:hypothetical protein
LVVEKTQTVGEVCAEERNDTLFVRYRTDGSWRLVETHLAVAGSREGIPLAGGQHPVLGRFPFKDAHVPAVPEFVYALPTQDLPADGELVIAAHATVARPGAEEGAWAAGAPFAGEGNPGTYFRYRRSKPGF